MKIGTKCKTRRRNGELVTGKVTGELWQGTRGDWLPFQFQNKKGKAVDIWVRPSQLTKI